MSALFVDLPPGIGDISWVYGKILDLTAEHSIMVKICGDEPRRSSPFVDLLPGLTNLGYGGHYRNMVKRLVPYQTDLRTLAHNKSHGICLNPHLEAGHRIELTYPAQTTHYHYHINTTDAHRAAAKSILDQAGDRPRIGYYCSSHKHRPDLGFWLERDWIKTLTGVLERVPTAQLFALGAPYDDKTINVHKLLNRPRSISAIGSDIGVTLEVLRGLDYFVAFPSGLGVLCDVIKTPCMMFYWSNILAQFKGFPGTYADPESIANKRHLILPYITPEAALKEFELHSVPWL